MAKNKIRRPIKIGGVTRWICGATEQEYAENLYKAMCAAAPAQAEAVQAEVPQGGRLFSAYAQTWFDVFAKPNIATATAVTYKRQLDAHINPVIGHKDVGEITAADVQAVFNAMGGVTKQTKDKVRTVLNQILNRAVDEGLLGRNPLSMRCIRITGEASRPTQVYPLDMMRQLAANLPRIQQERDRIFAALMAFHPLRQEEALGLKWADIDLEQGVIRVRRAVTHPKRNRPEIKETKTAGSKRELALVKEVAHLLPGGNGDDFVLGGAKPLSYTQVRSILRRIGKDIGVSENLNAILFRTTVLTDLYDQTKDIKQTQIAAGHTTAAMTTKYYVKGRSTNADTAQAISNAYGLAH